MLMQSDHTEQGAGTMESVYLLAGNWSRTVERGLRGTRLGGRPTGATGKTRTGCTNTTSSKY